ncbi:MAG: hypothetical protein RL431_387 [Actinomycetota bacterium]|jgi:hypothetical protein
MVYGTRLRASRGVSYAGLAGIGVLLFGIIMAPFSAVELSAARGFDGFTVQSFQSAAYRSAISFDDWSASSGVYMATAGEVRESQEFALQQVLDRGWDEEQFMCLVNLWNKESHWNYRAENRSSGAYGIPQALPGTKMASAGADWHDNPNTQILWGLGYIEGRYSTPCGAWQHSINKGWY